MLRDKIKPLIPQIVSRALTNRAVAALVGCSEYTVCHILRQLNVVREPIIKVDNAPARQLEASRREFRSKVAKTLPVKLAAEAANCSVRTIYRWKKRC